MKIDDKTLIDDVYFVIVDVETTGLNVELDKICEIAYIKMKGLDEVKRFATLVNPGRVIPQNVVRIHGITNEDVLESPVFSDIADKVVNDLCGTVVVGHNVDFDISFIDKELREVGLKMPDVYKIDTLSLSKKYISGMPNNKLAMVAERLNLVSEQWHRALNDVEITKEVFKYFVNVLMKDNQIKTLADLLKLV